MITKIKKVNVFLYYNTFRQLFGDGLELEEFLFRLPSILFLSFLPEKIKFKISFK